MHFVPLVVLAVFSCPYSDALRHHPVLALVNGTCKKRFKTNINVYNQWLTFPLTMFDNVGNISYKCQESYEEYLKGFYENDLLSMKMYDASAKLPSGILRGNVNQYGDIDECLEVSKAWYCLVDIDLRNFWKGRFAKYEHLVQSLYSIKDTFYDPGHRVPGFTFAKWGLCVPRHCTSSDIIKAVKQKLKVNANIRDGLCQDTSKNYQCTSFECLSTLKLFVLILLLVFTSTCLYQFKAYFSADNKIVQVYFGFALQKNLNALIIIDSNGAGIKCVHGVRALSALALLMSHKTMALLYNPYINRTYLAQTQAMTWSIIGRNAILYTDCFLLISGLLNATTLFDDMDKNNGIINVKRILIARLFRILPSLFSIILICTYLLPFMGSGPLWPLVINHHAELCKKYMYRNILFIHNYLGFDNMCLTHTHQVGIDMQLFLITPFIVHILWKFGRKGVYLIAFLSAGSTALRFWSIAKYNLSYIVHFGIPVSRMFRTANYSYILPTHRATIYFWGVLLAYMFRAQTSFSSMSKGRRICVGMIIYMLGLLTWLGPFKTSLKDYKYDRWEAAFYGAVAPITWGATITWIILSTEKKVNGLFECILTWKYFQFFTRIAYAVYLVQFPVFFYNVGVTRHVGEFKQSFMLPPGETSMILLLATILTVCVEMPFQNIFRVYFK